MSGRRHAWVLVCAVVACGRSGLDVPPRVDATAPPGTPEASVVDTGGRPAFDVSMRVDSGHDAGPMDSGHDATRPRDAGHDTAVPHDTGVDTGIVNPSTCPLSYPDNLVCPTLGAVCSYPQGQCTCFLNTICESCVPATCTQQGVHCGVAGDGCGGELHCGICQGGEKCYAGECIGADADICTLTTCAGLGKTCGVFPDGCQGTLDCGPCPVWSCNPASPPCPLTEPSAGASCTVDTATVCSYQRFDPSCCTYDYRCAGGAWLQLSMECSH